MHVYFTLKSNKRTTESIRTTKLTVFLAPRCSIPKFLSINWDSAPLIKILSTSCQVASKVDAGGPVSTGRAQNKHFSPSRLEGGTKEHLRLYLPLQKTSKAIQKASEFRRPSTPQTFTKHDNIWQIAFSPYCAAILKQIQETLS